MSMKKTYALLGLAAMMSSMDNPNMYDTSSGTNDGARKNPPKQKRPPKGAKEYWFNAAGEYSHETMRKTDVVFSCYAINDKNAVKKYNKWLATKK